MTQKQAQDMWQKAAAQLRKDKVLRPIIDRAGICPVRPKRDFFAKLVGSIISQQVSTKAAATIYDRFVSNFPRKRPTPQAVYDFLTTAPEEKIQAAGLSRQKRSYLLDLSQKFLDETIPHKRLSKMTDEEIIKTLTQIKGIGQWTVEMLLIFAMCRPDVWPIDDLGIQESIRIHFKMKERPQAKALKSFADHWKPYRSAAAWYLWRGKDQPKK